MMPLLDRSGKEQYVHIESIPLLLFLHAYAAFPMVVLLPVPLDFDHVDHPD